MLVLLLTGLSPLLTTVQAADSILLTASSQNVVLVPGQSTNISIDIENNGSSIETFNISVDDSSLASYWEILPVDTTVANVFPTWSKNTTVVIRLHEGATVADSGSFTVTVTEPDAGVSSTITVYVTVAPSYHPSLTASGNALVSMAAGASLNLTYEATNLGTVSDTFLLDVEVVPDLASWWANQTNGSTGNGTGNGTGNNGSNQSNQSSPLTVLMYGNSYTSANGLAALVDDRLDDTGLNATVQSNAAGGYTLADHWADVNASGTPWNSSLRNAAWDYVLLQDQSQVPSFSTTSSSWQESKNASVALSHEIEAEGASTVLFLTWGRRAGDGVNAFNNNFTSMQDRLTEGYTRYAENISNAGNSVYIAPVGLAFKTLHDAVVADGDDPTQAGNVFYDLYTSDGSHPSLTGSYLASCVLMSSLTGDACAGLTDSVAINSTVKLELQQAADDVVFNQTSGMSYYPWDVSGSSAFGLGSSIPSGWYLQWQDDELAEVAAGATRSTTLSLTAPADAVPDYYGYRLTIASVNGNITSSTVLVVGIEAEPALSLAFLDQDGDFIPGNSTITSVQVTNTGNQALDVEWSVVTDAPNRCTAAMVDAQSSGIPPGDVVDVEFMLTFASSSSNGDACEVSLTGIDGSSGAALPGGTSTFTILADERVDFSLAGPLTPVEMTPLAGANYELRVSNQGSDAATFYLDILPTTGLTTLMVSGSAVTVQPGETGAWTVNTKAQADMYGSLEQAFATSYRGVTVTADVTIELLEVADLHILEPSEDRVQVQPGREAVVSVVLVNEGTANLSLTSSLSGLPAGVTATVSPSGLSLNRSEQATVTLTLNASNGVPPGTSEVVWSYGDGGISSAFSFDLMVVDRVDVQVNTVTSRLFANPLSATSLTVDVTNTGTAADVYAIEWATESEGDWYSFSISPTTFQLSAGSTQKVIVEVTERSQGAPSDGVDYTFAVTSTTNTDASDSLVVTVASVQANADLRVLEDKSSAKPGGNVYGSVIVTNTGSASDTFTVTTVGTDCGLDTSVTLGPGLSSDALGWSCVVPNDAPAGQRSIVFRAVSALRSNVAIEEATLYTVDADWPGNTLVAITVEAATLTLGVDSFSSTTVVVENLANTEISGSLDVLGQDTGLMLISWQRQTDQSSTSDYVLSSGSRVEFKLTVTSNTARAGDGEIVVRATSTGGGVLTSDQSLPLRVVIEGPELPPNGLSLPLGVSVSQPMTLGVMGVGWLLAVAFFQVLRRKGASSPDAIEAEGIDEEEADDEDLKHDPPELGYNECRMDGDSKVNCPTCSARLGVPRGSTPPFRFTCPTCSNKIRVVE